MTMTGAEATLPRAADYPFAAPLEPFVFTQGDDAPAFAIDGRSPVLALGSNAAPAQLRRKFAGAAGHIPISRALLFDHVVVYSAHFTRYGALPATLHAYPGAVIFVAVTWLDAGQLARMHETEAVGVNYDYVELRDLRLEHDVETPPETPVVGAYLSRHGELLHDGRPIRLAETAASGCPLPALTQPAVLRFAHKRVAAGLEFDVFMTKLVEDAAFRQQCSRRLQLR